MRVKEQEKGWFGAGYEKKRTAFLPYKALITPSTNSCRGAPRRLLITTIVPSRSKPLYTKPKLPLPTRLHSSKFFVAWLNSSYVNCRAPWCSVAWPPPAEEIRPPLLHSIAHSKIMKDQKGNKTKSRRKFYKLQNLLNHNKNLVEFVPIVGGSDEPVSELLFARILRCNIQNHRKQMTITKNATAPITPPTMAANDLDISYRLALLPKTKTLNLKQWQE